jgi:hypothetical protein
MEPKTDEAIDGKSYYGYLFEDDKKPSKLLDALLRGIAKYIVRIPAHSCVGQQLTS